MMENKTKIDLKNKSIFITGVAGFIGSNLAKRLLSTVEGVKVVGLDNMNHYYDVRLKEARLNELEQFDNFSFVKGNLADKAVIESIFEQYKPEIVVNLGAQAGVRYSITNPDAYVEANLIGFYNILEACRHSYDEGHTPVEHLVYVVLMIAGQCALSLFPDWVTQRTIYLLVGGFFLALLFYEVRPWQAVFASGAFFTLITLVEVLAMLLIGLRMQVMGFYHHLPNDVERTYPQDLYHEEGQKALVEKLADPEQSAELLEQISRYLNYETLSEASV